MSKLALKLIKENKRTRSPFLDLGNCGLTNLPNELFSLNWLEWINLGDRYWSKIGNQWTASNNFGATNTIEILNLTNLKRLSLLQSLHLSYNQIRDIQSLEELTGLRALDLSSNQIREVWPLEELTGLQALDLSFNQIGDSRHLEKLNGLKVSQLIFNKISDYSFLEKFTGLQILDLSFNHIRNIQPLEKLTELQSLDLRNNKIRHYAFLEKLNKLKALHLSFNKVSNIQPLEKLIELRVLDLSNNQIRDIQPLEKLIELQVLDLSNNQISNIQSLEKLNQLKSLDLRNNQINNILTLEKLTGLQSLNLSFNQISDYSFLEKLTELKVLYLNFTKISNYSFLEKLSELQELHLIFNQISDIQYLEKLSRLKVLDLSSNYIIDIRPLEKLNELQALDLSNNKIRDYTFLEKLIGIKLIDIRLNEIIDIQFFKKTIGLQSLNLRGNYVRDYSFLEKLTELQILHLRNNKISDHSFLEKLTRLQALDLSFNQISDLQLLEKLTDLKTLDLNSNHIIDIQPLEKLIELQSLDLRNNKIKLLSERTLRALPRLDTLYLNHNPVENIPREIFDKENINVVNNIRAYFASLKKGIAINNEVKLIIVGNTTAGKTSLTRFLQNSVYEKTQNSTHGISLQRWEVKHKQFPLQVNIWDFGGQEYYHATHRLFLDDRAVYLVVWEASTNIQGVQDTVIYLSNQRHVLPLEHFPYDYWLESIRYYAPQSTILMVQTKIDKTANGPQPIEKLYFDPPYNVQYPTYQLSVQNAYANKDSNSITFWQEFKAFETQLLSILKNDAAKYPLGIKWVEIRDAIRKMAGEVQWLSLNEFEAFCFNIDPTIELNVLMDYLGGSASTILYYEHDPELSNIVFLNPQWVSDTIYDILSYDIQENHKGEFTRIHVEQVLAEKGMIPTMADVFLGLMKAHRFELIFVKPNSKDIYIAPQYLPEQYDVEALEFFRPVSALQLTLHFPHFMPRSIFLRFMVRYGEQAKCIYWKHGVILYKDGVRIIAECFFSDRKITVSIDDKLLPEAKQLAQELFYVLWELSDKKKDITVSVNREDFVEVGQLERCVKHSKNTEVESTAGKWLPVKNLSYLFGKYISDPIMPVESTPIDESTPPKSNPEVFFSYAWGRVDEDREKIVNALYESLKANGYNVIRDKMDLGYKKLISDFMKRIGRGNIVVVALSDKYLKSSFCMFELYEAFRNSKLEREEFIKRIFPIRTESIDLSPRCRSIYRDHWESQKKEWDKYIRKYSREISASEQAEFERIKSIVANLGNLFEILADINAETIELLSQNDFTEIKKSIDERIRELDH